MPDDRGVDQDVQRFGGEDDKGRERQSGDPAQRRAGGRGAISRGASAGLRGGTGYDRGSAAAVHRHLQRVAGAFARLGRGRLRLRLGLGAVRHDRVSRNIENSRRVPSRVTRPGSPARSLAREPSRLGWGRPWSRKMGGWYAPSLAPRPGRRAAHSTAAIASSTTPNAAIVTTRVTLIGAPAPRTR